MALRKIRIKKSEMSKIAMRRNLRFRQKCLKFSDSSKIGPLGARDLICLSVTHLLPYCDHFVALIATLKVLYCDSCVILLQP